MTKRLTKKRAEQFRRQPGMLFSGLPTAIPGLDADRVDNVQVLVVDKDATNYGELPASTLGSVTWKLRDPSSTTIDMSAYDVNAPLVQTGKREIRIIFWDVIRPDTDEPLVWWGRAAGKSGAPGKVQFALDDVSTWLKERVISVDKDYEAVDAWDQVSIGWDLINYAQTGANRDLNITNDGVPLSGRTRERHYKGDQKPIVYDQLNNFQGIIDGFEWWMDYDLSGRRIWKPEYPQRGVHTGIKLEWGQNISGYSLKEDGATIITRYWAQGGNDPVTNLKIEREFEDVAASVEYGQRERAGSEGTNESTVEYLDDRAQFVVENNNKPKLVLSVAVWEGSIGDETVPVPLLGRLWPGDWVIIVIDDGANQVPAIELRVSSIKWLPAGGLDLEFEL